MNFKQWLCIQIYHHIKIKLIVIAIAVPFILLFMSISEDLWPRSLTENNIINFHQYEKINNDPAYALALLMWSNSGGTAFSIKKIPGKPTSYMVNGVVIRNILRKEIDQEVKSLLHIPLIFHKVNLYDYEVATERSDTLDPGLPAP